MHLITASILLIASLVQAATGFGSALVAMSILPSLVGIRVAAPLMALTSITLEIVLLIRYRSVLSLTSVWRMSLASMVGIPVGLFLVQTVQESLVLTALGVVLVSYSLYALRSPLLPEFSHGGWAFAFGFLAGVLSGAYNVAGPMAVIYGNCRRWGPDEFKSNLQAFFLVNDVFVLLNHALAGNVGPIVSSHYLAALPAIALGLYLGAKLGRRFNPDRFRKIVLIFLMVMGLRPILGWCGLWDWLRSAAAG
jgi:uncharacterized protein